MLYLALRTLRARWTGFLGAIIAIALAVGLSAACGILLESGLRAGVPADRLAGADLVVAGRHTLTVTRPAGDGETESTSSPLSERIRLDGQLAERLRAVPGVRVAVPDVTFPLQVVTLTGQPVDGLPGAPSWGHGWQAAPLTPFAVRTGRAPTRPGELALDQRSAGSARVAVGSRVRLVTRTGSEPATVVGIVASHGRTGLARQSAVFVADVEATRLAGHPGQVDAVGLLAQPGTDQRQLARQVRAAIQDAADAVVLTGKHRGEAEFPGDADANEMIIAIGGSFGGSVLCIAMFVVAATLAVAVQQRHREIALLRAVGTTPRQVRRMIAAETLLVSVVGGAAGIPPAVGIASLLRRGFVARDVIPAGFVLHIGPLPFVAAIGGALITTQLAALVTGRRAAGIRPTEALQESATQPRRLGAVRLLLGLLFLAGGGVLLRVATAVPGENSVPIALAVVLVLIIAASLFGPLVAAVGVRLLGPVARLLSPVGGFLAAVEASARSRRFASAATPVVLTVALAGTVVFLNATLVHAADQQGRDRVRADRVLVAGQAGLPPDTVDRLAERPGIAAAVGLRPTTVLVTGDLEAEQAQVVSPGRLDAVLDLGVTSGTLPALRGNEVALSTNLARLMHGTVGETVSLRLGDGTPARLRLVAIYTRPLGFADALLSWDTAAGHITEPTLTTVLVRSAPGSDVRVDAALRAILDNRPGAQVISAAGYRGQLASEQQVNVSLNYLLVGLVVAFAAISVVNTLVMTTAERGREFALLRLVGATRRQVLRSVYWEAALLSVFGVLLGSVIAGSSLAPISRGLTGSSVPHLPLAQYLPVVAAAVALVFVAAMLPARAALARSADMVAST